MFEGICNWYDLVRRAAVHKDRGTGLVACEPRAGDCPEQAYRVPCGSVIGNYCTRWVSAHLRFPIFLIDHGDFSSSPASAFPHLIFSFLDYAYFHLMLILQKGLVCSSDFIAPKIWLTSFPSPYVIACKKIWDKRVLRRLHRSQTLNPLPPKAALIPTGV